MVENIQALPPTIEGNRQMLAWLRGERQWYDEAEQRHRQVRLIDFDEPSANVLHVTWEWRLKPPARKGNRADVMFVVNGVPVAIVEHKNPTGRRRHRAGGHAAAPLRDRDTRAGGRSAALQRDPPPRLLVWRHLETCRAATWRDGRRPRTRATASPSSPSSSRRTSCARWRDWILFYVEDGETRKTVLRQHQRRAVDRIVERCTETAKHRGLVWHTQGAGKTFTLLTAAPPGPGRPRRSSATRRWSS